MSVFPGIGLLDRAFEEAGFCVVRGPDLLWGGDIDRFHPPAGRFDGVIGGPPCQAWSSFAHMNRAQGNSIAIDKTPDFGRVVEEAQPAWWLMENAPAVPDLLVPGYVTARTLLDNRWLGEEQERRRAFQFGTRDGRPLHIVTSALPHPVSETTCLASEGGAGRIMRKRGKAHYLPRRPWSRFCELQGLEPDFLSHAPLTNEGKYRVVGNGVPLFMGRAVAAAVLSALSDRRVVAA
ncbi:MAG: DNA cytosine methyltransferase [Caulobacter sp.]